MDKDERPCTVEGFIMKLVRKRELTLTEGSLLSIVYRLSKNGPTGVSDGYLGRELNLRRESVNRMVKVLSGKGTGQRKTTRPAYLICTNQTSRRKITTTWNDESRSQLVTGSHSTCDVASQGLVTGSHSPLKEAVKEASKAATAGAVAGLGGDVNSPLWENVPVTGQKVKYTDQDVQWARRLRAAATRMGKKQPWRLSAWADQFRLLRADRPEVSESDLDEILKWYCKAAPPDKRFRPRVPHAEAFRKAFDWIEELHRKSRNDVSQIEVSDSVKSSLAYFAGKGWPGDSFARMHPALQKSIDNWRAMVKQVEDLAKWTGDRAHEWWAERFHNFNESEWIELAHQAVAHRNFRNVEYFVWSTDHKDAHVGVRNAVDDATWKQIKEALT